MVLFIGVEVGGLALDLLFVLDLLLKDGHARAQLLDDLVLLVVVAVKARVVLAKRRQLLSTESKR